MTAKCLVAFSVVVFYCASCARAQTLEWIRQLGTSEGDSARGVSADGLGNVYISGWTGGILGEANAGRRDAFLAKYDASGTLEWTQQLGTSGNEWSYGVSADGLGGVYISGYTSGSLVGTNAGWSDAFISKYDESGRTDEALQWRDRANEWTDKVACDGKRDTSWKPLWYQRLAMNLLREEAEEVLASGTR